MTSLGSAVSLTDSCFPRSLSMSLSIDLHSSLKGIKRTESSACNKTGLLSQKHQMPSWTHGFVHAQSTKLVLSQIYFCHGQYLTLPDTATCHRYSGGLREDLDSKLRQRRHQATTVRSMSFATRSSASFNQPTLAFMFLVDHLWLAVQEKADAGPEYCVTALTKATGVIWLFHTAEKG